MRKAHYPQMCDVDAVLRQIELEEQRQIEAIDAFYRREASAKPVVSWKLALVGLFCGAAAVSWLLWYFVITPAVDALKPVLDKLQQ